MSIVLWIVQILLAALFLFAGGTKLVLPIDVLTSMGSPNQVHLPALLIRFIGVCARYSARSVWFFLASCALSRA